MNPASLVLVSSFHQPLRPPPAPRRGLQVSFTRRGSGRTPQARTELKHSSGGDYLSLYFSLYLSLYHPALLLLIATHISPLFTAFPSHTGPLLCYSCSSSAHLPGPILFLLTSLLSFPFMFIVTLIFFIYHLPSHLSLTCSPHVHRRSYHLPSHLSPTCTSPLHRRLYLPFTSSFSHPAGLSPPLIFSLPDFIVPHVVLCPPAPIFLPSSSPPGPPRHLFPPTSTERRRETVPLCQR